MVNSKFSDLQRQKAEKELGLDPAAQADAVAAARPELQAQTADGSKFVAKVKKAHADKDIGENPAIVNLQTEGEKPQIHKFQCDCACPKASDVEISVEDSSESSAGLVRITVEQPTL